jgi:hypothetical protein
MYLTECPFSAFKNFEILPLETLPPGESNGGVVCLRIVLSPEEASHIVSILMCVFIWKGKDNSAARTKLDFP